METDRVVIKNNRKGGDKNVCVVWGMMRKNLVVLEQN